MCSFTGTHLRNLLSAQRKKVRQSHLNQYHDLGTTKSKLQLRPHLDLKERRKIPRHLEW